MKANTMVIETIVIFMASLMALIFSSCTIHKVSDKDKGPKITKEYNIKDFTSINIESAGDVAFVQDSIYSIKIEATQGTLNRLEVQNINGSLVIGEKKSEKKVFSFGSNIGSYKITIHAPEINAIAIAGAGDFDSEKITTENLSLTLAGAGNVAVKEFEGNSIKVSLAGSGDIDITEKNVAQSEFSVAGSGNINAKLKDCGYIKAGIAGSGDITLSGNAKHADTGVAGSGEINKEGLTINK